MNKPNRDNIEHLVFAAHEGVDAEVGCSKADALAFLLSNTGDALAAAYLDARAMPERRFSSSDEPGQYFDLASFVADNAADFDAVEEDVAQLARLAIGEEYEIDLGAGGRTTYVRCSDDDAAADQAAVDAFDAWSDAVAEHLGNYLDRAMSRPRDGGLSAEIARAADDLVSACEGAPLLVRLLPEAPKLGHALADKATRTLDAASTAVAMHNEATARGIAWDDVEHVIADYLGDDERVRMARAVRGARK